MRRRGVFVRKIHLVCLFYHHVRPDICFAPHMESPFGGSRASGRFGGGQHDDAGG